MCIGSDKEAEVLFKVPRCLRETIHSHTKRINGEEVLLRSSEASARNVRNSRTGVEEIRRGGNFLNFCETHSNFCEVLKSESRGANRGRGG
jgi:hypothetical protein